MRARFSMGPAGGCRGCEQARETVGVASSQFILPSGCCAHPDSIETKGTWRPWRANMSWYARRATDDANWPTKNAQLPSVSTSAMNSSADSAASPAAASPLRSLLSK